MEWRLFNGDIPHVSTFEFHEHRERAPHLEQAAHRARLELAYALSQAAVLRIKESVAYKDHIIKIVDLGCGDGGLMSLMKSSDTKVFGFDFQPSNVVGWAERGVDAYWLNFVEQWEDVDQAEIYTITECLEHLANPHQMVASIRARNAQIVASSPWTEHAGSHDECHAWAWDMSGYAEMLTNAGFNIASHSTTGMFQVIWGVPNA